MGSSKPWEEILEEFADVKTFSAKACLKYFQPLRDYLEELVAKGELKVGWQCKNDGYSTYRYVGIMFWFMLIMKFIFSSIFFRL